MHVGCSTQSPNNLRFSPRRLPAPSSNAYVRSDKVTSTNLYFYGKGDARHVKIGTVMNLFRLLGEMFVSFSYLRVQFQCYSVLDEESVSRDRNCLPSVFLHQAPTMCRPGYKPIN